MRRIKSILSRPLDALWLLRTRYLFLTASEARAAIAAANQLDTEAGKAMVQRLNEQFAALQQVQARRQRNLVDVRLMVNVASLEHVDDDTATEVLAEMVVRRIMVALQRHKDRSRAERNRKEANARPE